MASYQLPVTETLVRVKGDAANNYSRTAGINTSYSRQAPPIWGIQTSLPSIFLAPSIASDTITPLLLQLLFPLISLILQLSWSTLIWFWFVLLRIFYLNHVTTLVTHPWRRLVLMLNEQMNIVKSSPFFQKAVKGKGKIAWKRERERGRVKWRCFQSLWKGCPGRGEMVWGRSTAEGSHLTADESHLCS